MARVHNSTTFSGSAAGLAARKNRRSALCSQASRLALRSTLGVGVVASLGLLAPTHAWAQCVVGGVTVLVVPPLQPIAPFAFGLYGAAAVVEAIRVSRRHSLTLAPVVAAIFPVLHASHGIGFAAGLARYALRPDWE